MGVVPSLEELGVEGLLPKEPAEAGTPGGRVWANASNGVTDGAGAQRRREEYKALNGMLFLTFVVPTAFAALVWGIRYAAMPYSFVIVWVHEAGHGFWCLLGSRLLCASAGFSSELMVTLVPALICLRDRKTYLAACVLLMCVGFSLQHNGLYMQTAENPTGTSFAGALTHRYNDMSPENHDWSIVFDTFGIVEYSYNIGGVVEEVGLALAAICFFASVIAFFPMLGGAVPKNIDTVAAPGAAVATVLFIASGGTILQIVLSLAVARHLIMLAAKRFRR